MPDEFGMLPPGSGGYAAVWLEWLADAMKRHEIETSLTGDRSGTNRCKESAPVSAWIDAEVQDDRAVLEEILHEDFVSTFASGKTLDREAYIDFILALDISPFTVNNESMTQFGDTVVVVDVSDSGTTKFTWIAVKRDDQWIVIAQTFSRIEPTDP